MHSLQNWSDEKIGVKQLSAPSHSCNSLLKNFPASFKQPIIQLCVHAVFLKNSNYEFFTMNYKKRHFTSANILHMLTPQEYDISNELTYQIRKLNIVARISVRSHGRNDKGDPDQCS